MSTAPVLLIAFNRPAHTREVLRALRPVAPPRLYISCDGPRDDVEADRTAVAEVRQMIDEEIDWSGDIFTMYHSRNLGCRDAVVAALDWFFGEVEEGIILEDDCVPAPSFFPFASELLNRYRDNSDIYSISGQGFGSRIKPELPSYVFTRFPHMWGWATWRRSWERYDKAMESWPNRRDSQWLREIGRGDEEFVSYWRARFDDAYSGRIDTWDYQWIYTCWSTDGLSIAPTVNLVKNIGFDEAATHTVNSATRLAHLKCEDIRFPLRHPFEVAVEPAVETFRERRLYALGKSKLRRRARKQLAFLMPIYMRVKRRVLAFLHSTPAK